MKKTLFALSALFMFISSFAQYTWHDVTDTLHRNLSQDIRKVKFANKDTGYIIGPSLFKYTHDAGKSWHNIATTAPQMMDIMCASSKVAYASADSGLVMRTADGGVNWSTVNLPVKRLTGLHRTFGDDNIYAVTYGPSSIFNPWLEEYVGMGPSGWKFDTLWHSTDGGAHWSKITNVNNQASNVFRYVVDDSTYIRNNISGGHGMEVSYNTGATYTKDYPIVETFSIQQLPSGAFFWVCNSDNFNYIYSTTDRFKHYDVKYQYDISHTNQLMFKRLSFANEGTGWVYGGQVWPIYKTNDSAKTFFQDKQGLSSLAEFWNPVQVQLLDSNYGWGIMAIDTGRNRLVKYGEYTTDTGSGPTTGLQSYIKSVASVYPNPGTGLFSVGASSPIEQVAVFSLDGKAILATRETTLDLRSQNSGIYMVEVTLRSGERLYEKLVKE